MKLYTLNGYLPDTIYNFNFDYECGATKCCIFKNNYVYKIPLDGIIEKIGDGYSLQHYEDDYCELEWNNYSYAKKAGVNQFFAKIERIGKNLYKQELLKPYHRKQSYSGDGYVIEKPEMDALRKCYSESEIESLLKFIKDEGINDLFAQNFGYDKQGKLKIFDYSGYYGYFDWSEHYDSLEEVKDRCRM